MITGKIEPIIPKTKPSKIKGIFIFILDAPTNRIISISLRREKIVIFIVLDIKKAVTKIRATTTIKLTFLIEP